jgi:2-C-methyl-D-erythritol 4-phosphate cytidylyltransferase
VAIICHRNHPQSKNNINSVITMHERVAAVIVAAGSSQRMQGRDKLWIPLGDRITLARTIDVFEASPLIDTIVLVLNTERIPDASVLCQQEDWSKIASIIAGGPRRQDSVRIGLDTLAQIDPGCSWVMIHDGARPLVTPNILEAGLKAAREYSAAIAGVPVKDTIKQVQQGLVHTTLDRSQLWSVQTPQVFSFPLILSAHHTPEAQEDITDDAVLLERLGQPVAIFPGSYTNIKITTKEDLVIAEALLQQREDIDIGAK